MNFLGPLRISESSERNRSIGLLIKNGRAKNNYESSKTPNCSLHTSNLAMTQSTTKMQESNALNFSCFLHNALKKKTKITNNTKKVILSQLTPKFFTQPNKSKYYAHKRKASNPIKASNHPSPYHSQLSNPSWANLQRHKNSNFLLFSLCFTYFIGNQLKSKQTNKQKNRAKPITVGKVLLV